MAGRECSAVEAAVKAVLEDGMSQKAAAEKFGCARQSVRLAILRRGVATPGRVKGEKHHAWKGGAYARTPVAATP